MGLIDRLNKKQERLKEEVQTREEEFVSLIRVYLQAVIASDPKLGVSNINMLPDLRLFKRTLKIPTQGRLGLGERNTARKLLSSQYGIPEFFFEELDKSVRKACHKQQDVQSFFFMFQSFTNDLLMVLSNDLQWRLRIPSFFRKLIKSSIVDGVEDIMHKSDWTAADVFQACQRLRKDVDKLGYSHKWMAEYAFPMLMIAKGAKVRKQK
jgi:hypothetical protein